MINEGEGNKLDNCERASKKEHDQGVPFVGGAGQTLRKWFDRAKLDLDNFRRWNVCIDYKPDNPKPLGWEIEPDRLAVETDIVRCQPNVIVAVGVHAMRWRLRRRFDLGTIHGRKFEWYRYATIRRFACRSIILPPSGGLSERRWGRPTFSPWRGCCGA
jgi:uracil-DNA glycosylase family 4